MLATLPQVAAFPQGYGFYDSDDESVAPPLQDRSFTDPGLAKHDDELDEADADPEGADRPLAEAEAEEAGGRKLQLHQVHDLHVDSGLATSEWVTDDEREGPMPPRVANGPPSEAHVAGPLVSGFVVLMITQLQLLLRDLMREQGWHLLPWDFLSEEWTKIGLRIDVIQPMAIRGVSYHKLEPIAAERKRQNLDENDPDKAVLGEVISCFEEWGSHIISASHLGKALNLQRLGRLQAGSSEGARRKAAKKLFTELKTLGVHTAMVNGEEFYCNP